MVLLTLASTQPARADENKPAASDRPPAALNNAEKRVDLTQPPSESADPAMNATGQAMAATGGVSPNVKLNCGIVTCSLYLSKKETQAVAKYGAVAATGMGLLPAAAGKVLGAVASLVNWKATQAARKNQCLRIRFTGEIDVVGLYSDHSKYCRP